MTCSVSVSEYLAMSQIAFGVATAPPIGVRRKNPTWSLPTEPMCCKTNGSLRFLFG
jgi:hypothetical protein